MKTRLGTTAIIVALLCAFSSSSLAQSVGNFQSHQAGDWSDTTSWERWDGLGWITPAPSFPTSMDSVITILNGHTIILDTSISVDQINIQTSGMMTVGVGKTLTVADGADSVDMTVSGTLNSCGTVIATGRISVENGGLFIYSVPAGGDIPLPAFTWRAGSTCRIDSTTGTTPTSLKNQSLYNLIWNGTTSGANGGPNFNDGTVIAGDVTISSSKNYQWRITNLSGGQIKNIFIRGNVNVDGVDAYLTATGSGADTLAKAVIFIDGSVNVTAGRWSLNNSSNVYAEWRIKGDINVIGGTLQSGNSGWYGRRTVDFISGGTQTFTVTAPGTVGSATTMFKVSNGTNVQMNSPFTLMANGALDLTAGGTFVTSLTNLLTIPATGVVLGGSDSSYVNGPLAIVVAETNVTKTFPIGNGSAYRPVTLTLNHDASTATTYMVEMINTAPAPKSLPATLKDVSSVRYYHVDKGTGANLSPTLGATIQLAYNTDDLITDSSVVRIAEDSSGISWLNIGGSGTASTDGTITSNVFFSLSSNDFVLAIADTTVAVTLPTLTTSSVTKISTTIATSGGNITNDGGGAVSARGVCWNTAGTPTIYDNTLLNGAGTGVFSSSLTGLTPGTTYYLRAFAINNAGTAYGNEVSFSTLTSIVPPSVTTMSISNIQVTTAISGGNVTDWGGDSVTARGICWDTSASPTIIANHSLDGSDIGPFASGLAPLVGGTTYYVRAYAANSAGIGYGNELSFTTQTPAPDTTVIVAKDGSGNFTTVQEAFRAVPLNYTGHWNIFVKKGTYYEKDTLISGKINVVLMGEDRDSTIITYDDYADRYGSGVPGTSGSFSVAIDASDFTAKNITFQNTYYPHPGVTGTQAVALRTQGDRHEYINCKLLGYQDTYYTWGGNGTGRMYHKNCIIEGTVDFIFGRNIVVFDSCIIRVRRNGGTLTAASTDGTSQYGYVFRNCTLATIDTNGYDGNPVTSFYLGRPWQGSPRTVFMATYEPSSLQPAGWLAWNVQPALYAEYKCFGPGSGTSSRVAWSSQLSPADAANYRLINIFAKSSASSSLILYNWMPPDATPDDDMPVLVSVERDPDTRSVPAGFSLSQNFPNPFNPATTISYNLPKSCMVSLKVYDLFGREVATLVNGMKTAGSYREVFDAKRLASGVYFARLKTEMMSKTIKLVLTK